MRVLYFDTFSGISGDMALGALIDAGVSEKELIGELSKIKNLKFQLKTEKLKINGIQAVNVNVITDEKIKHRKATEIFRMIDESGLSDEVKKMSKNIFKTIAEAEAKLHGVAPQEVEFHEVGAVDSIVDIVGVSICIEKLGVDKIYSSKVPVGSGGFVDSSHGKLPVPSPATMEILKDFPVVLTNVKTELTTPTGAGIIKTLAQPGFETEIFKVKRIGYGAGKKNIADVPNMLRVIIGEVEKYEFDKMVLIETNIDDMNPEIYPYVSDRLFEAGASDVYFVPVIMKKGRPGVILSTLVREEKMHDILKIIFSETSTTGVRIKEVERRKLPRKIVELETGFGKVKFKSIDVDGFEKLVPEFEECKRIAREKNLPLIEVYRILQTHVKK